MPRIDTYPALASLADDDELIAWDTSAGAVVNVAPSVLATKLATNTAFSSRFRSDGLNVRNPENLRRWVAASGDALFGAYKQPVISCFGDSITTGANAHNDDTGASTTAERVKYRERGWVGTLRAMLANRYGFGGEGFMFATPTTVTSQFQEDRVACASSATTALNTGPLSSGRKIVSGESITWSTSDPCTSVDIIYGTHPTAVAAFTVSIDGGSAVTATDPATTEGVAVYSVTGLSDAPHTITVNGPGTKYADIGGCIARRGTGVLVNRIAKGGGTSSTLIAPTSGAQAIARMMSATFNATDTDLAIVMLRYNDRDGDTVPPTGSLSFQSNLQTFCDAAVAAGGCVLLIPDPPGVYSGSPTYTEDEYAAVMQSISDNTDHVAYLDLSSIFNTFAAADALGLYQDNVVHPNSRGHGLIGQLIYDVTTSAHRSA